MTGSIPYNGGTISSWFVFMDKEKATTRSIGKSEIVKEGKNKSGVYLPMIYQSEDIQIGDTIDITIGSNKMSYTVCGFFNNTMIGSHNCYMIEIILSEDKYKELKDSTYVMPAKLCSIRLKDKGKSVDFETELKSLISKKFPNTVIVSNQYENSHRRNFKSVELNIKLLYNYFIFINK